MWWVFEVFMDVIQVIVTESGKIIKTNMNLSSLQITILSLRGRECEYYYGMN